jgi:hypothetical protein
VTSRVIGVGSAGRPGETTAKLDFLGRPGPRWDRFFLGRVPLTLEEAPRPASSSKSRRPHRQVDFSTLPRKGLVEHVPLIFFAEVEAGVPPVRPGTPRGPPPSGVFRGFFGVFIVGFIRGFSRNGEYMGCTRFRKPDGPKRLSSL